MTTPGNLTGAYATSQPYWKLEAFNFWNMITVNQLGLDNPVRVWAGDARGTKSRSLMYIATFMVGEEKSAREEGGAGNRGVGGWGAHHSLCEVPI